MTRPTLLIFAKPPRIALSKTRLAAGLGGTEARRIARFTLARTMRAARDTAWETRLYVEPYRALDDTLGGLWPPHISRYPQGKGNLGDRLTRAMMEAPHGPIIFVGADAPEMTHTHLRQAATSLRRNGLVFGPADDGGFWLLGLSERLKSPDVFKDVRWSTPHAMEDVWSNLPEHARVTLLPQLIDIDIAEDWKRYKKQQQGF
ncbi:TIGR04282 family arsenosugar biosynthesis glycosyltransferase [Henriciella sp. AS95]|uniref:TIGR04282 family arsenosugar biosynthesis glycosyltransferase n=1 Tax=Henriciella sp. AS95 TaxID=3135782 RepID=UPI00317483D3